MILIVSHLGDSHAVSVMKKLDEKGFPYYLFDTSSYPTNTQLSFEYDVKMKGQELWDVTGDLMVDFSKVKVAWWRRPLPTRIDDEIKDSNAIQFTYNECSAALSGLWKSMDTLWINDPLLDDAASRKIYQLKVAGELGFKIPQTCITNNEKTLQQFVNNLKGKKIIYKCFLSIEKAWRETRILTDEEMKNMEYIRFAPVIFQEFIPAEVDLRITIIGNQIFCISVDTSKNGYPYDYRMSLQEAVIKPYSPPSKLKKMLLDFMKHLGLVYGAIDMRLTPEGEFYFLEINTSGEWQFLEEQSTLKITDYFAAFMMENCGKPAGRLITSI